MKYKTKITQQIIGLLIFISSPFLLNASHIIGGKITYRYIGSNKYEIKLTVYRDCSDPIDFDNPSPITIYDNSNNSLVSNHQVSLFQRDTLHANNPDPCFIPPAGICVEEGFFLDTVLLPTNSSGYTISYQRCCHNSSVLNIINPAMVGTTITAQIPPQQNNSATFLNYPPIFVCVNDTFNYSFASFDIDGDSLAYSMCNPFDGGTNFNVLPNPAFPPPYSTIPWSSGFTTTNPITTSNGINFNSNTGTINFIPTMQGQFAVGICVNEYRNGNLLNTNHLEIQFNVVPCYIVSSIPTATNICDGLNINFQNNSTNATNFHWDFGITNTLTDTSNIQSPNFTFPAFGTYTVSLIAINTSYGICKDTSYKTITVNPLLAPTIPPYTTGCYNQNNTQLTVGGIFDSSATFNWNLGSTTTPSTATQNSITANFTTDYQHVQIYVSQFGCIDTLETIVNLFDVNASSNANDFNCKGKTLTFQNYSTGATNYFWDFGVTNITSDTSSQASPTYIYPQSGIYDIMQIAYNNSCRDTIIYHISINDSLLISSIITNSLQCLNNNSFDFLATGMFSSNAYFTWAFDPSANTTISHLQSPQNIQFSTSGGHLINLYLTENNCSVHANTIIKILPSPTANFIVSDTVGCQPLKINFTNQSTSSIPFTSTWQIENNSFNSFDTLYTFNNSGLYSIYLVVNDTNNCTDTLNKVNYIIVLPKPTALASVTPFKTDILNPIINFTDNTLGNHTTNFDFGDNTNSNQIINNHIYSEIGIYNYQLIVTNNFGCTDTTKGTITIEPFNALFVPNSFTPNSDGLNDTFKPIIPYYKNATLQIFNRWGDLILNTNNIEQGWDGKIKGLNAPNDVYVYKIVVEYLDGTTKNLIGHISLTR